MTAKEKSRELVDKFLCIEDNEDLFCDECGMSEEAAKLCALISVDEILKTFPKQWNGFEYESCDDYWQEVKQELLKL
jgi:hypothetical protein